MTRIVAALPWYDEPVSFLDRCVRSLEGVADELVALDGRWKLFGDDEAPVLSHWTQSHAIAKAADATGLEHAVWMGPTVWETQVAKRAALMELASEKGDWVFVIDADEYVAACDIDALKQQLADTELHVATVTLTNMTTDRPAGRIRRIYRSGTTVQTAHNGYRYHDQWLHGDGIHVKLAPALDTSDVIRLHDRGHERDQQRIDTKRAYSRARQRHRVEAWR